MFRCTWREFPCALAIHGCARTRHGRQTAEQMDWIGPGGPWYENESHLDMHLCQGCLPRHHVDQSVHLHNYPSCQRGGIVIRFRAVPLTRTCRWSWAVRTVKGSRADAGTSQSVDARIQSSLGLAKHNRARWKEMQRTDVSAKTWPGLPCKPAGFPRLRTGTQAREQCGCGSFSSETSRVSRQQAPKSCFLIYS